MYLFLVMWLLLATLSYQLGSRTKDWKWWLLFSIAAAFAQYTHNLAAFYLVALALTPLFQKDWMTLRATIFAGCLAILFYMPWLIQLPAQLAKVGQGYWVERPDVSRLFTLLIVYVTITPLPDSWIVIALLISLLVVTLGIVQTARFTRQTKTCDGVLVFYLSFGPPLLLFIFSQWQPVYIERALLASGAIFCVWMAWVISGTGLSTWVRSFLLFLLVIASAMGIYEHVTYRGFPYGPFQELDRSLEERFEPGDLILHANKRTMLPALLFDRDLPQTFIGDPPGSPADTLAPATQEVLRIEARTDIVSATAGAKRIWFIVYPRPIDELGTVGNAALPELAYLDTNYVLLSQENWEGLRVFLYAGEP